MRAARYSEHGGPEVLAVGGLSAGETVMIRSGSGVSAAALQLGADEVLNNRGVHTVVVDGRIVVEDGHMTTIDEAALWSEAQRRGEAIVNRSGLPDKAKFPTW